MITKLLIFFMIFGKVKVQFRIQAESGSITSSSGSCKKFQILADPEPDPDPLHGLHYSEQYEATFLLSRNQWFIKKKKIKLFL
jgi:hypothetical protein